jgi:hypothetical protein
VPLGHALATSRHGIWGTSGGLGGDRSGRQSARLQQVPTGLPLEVVVVPAPTGAIDASPGRKPWERAALVGLAPEGRQRAAPGVSPARERQRTAAPSGLNVLYSRLPHGWRHGLSSVAPSGGSTTQRLKLQRIGVWGAGRRYAEHVRATQESAAGDALCATCRRTRASLADREVVCFPIAALAPCQA